MSDPITARLALEQLLSLRARRSRLRDELDQEGIDQIGKKLDQAWRDAEKALASQTVEVPAGWQLVPIELSPPMIEAICRAHTDSVWPGAFGIEAQRLRREHAADGWDAALRVAPKPREGV